MNQDTVIVNDTSSPTKPAVTDTTPVVAGGTPISPTPVTETNELVIDDVVVQDTNVVKLTTLPDQPVVTDDEEMDNVNKPIPVKYYTETVQYTERIEEFDEKYDQIYLPSSIRSDIQQQIETINEKDLGKDKQTGEWARALIEGTDITTYNDAFTETVTDPSRMWRQEVESPSGPLSPGKPKFSVKPNTEYAGEAKYLRFKAALGMGTAFTVPLWHSGFWITIKTPSDSDLLELYRTLSNEKVTLGRSSYGLMFSNGTAYSYSALLDFVIDNIYGVSVSLKEDTDIRTLIDTRDLMPLFLGLTAATWPRGVEYARACLADVTEETKCNYVTKERLNPAKLLWTDDTRLTERQRAHMSKRMPSSTTLDEVKLYCSELLHNSEETFTIENCVITIKTPTAAEYVASGKKWISVLESKYKSSLLEETEDRERYLYSQARANALRQYGHYIKSIRTDDLSVTDVEEVETILDFISSEDELRNKIFKQIAEYIDKSVISVVGIPTFKCPNCGNEHSPYSEKGVYSTIIPLDVVSSFFTLMAQKALRISTR